EENPEVFTAYQSLGELISKQVGFEPKTRELLKLAMAAGIGSEGAAQSHTHRALEAGASQEEIEQTLLLGVTTLGFPRMMAALTWAKEALEESVET
ncbi:MAG: carboxymuconolactone decarboxylase family protein, partial [Anaerolineales bacterium]